MQVGNNIRLCTDLNFIGVVNLKVKRPPELLLFAYGGVICFLISGFHIQ